LPPLVKVHQEIARGVRTARQGRVVQSCWSAEVDPGPGRACSRGDVEVVGPAVGVEVGELDPAAVDADTAGDLAARIPVPVAAVGLGAAVPPDMNRAVVLRQAALSGIDRVDAALSGIVGIDAALSGIGVGAAYEDVVGSPGPVERGEPDSVAGLADAAGDGALREPVPVAAAGLRTAVEPSLDGTVIVDLHVISSAVTIKVRETDIRSRCADTAGDRALRQPVPVAAAGIRPAVDPSMDETDILYPHINN